MGNRTSTKYIFEQSNIINYSTGNLTLFNDMLKQDRQPNELDKELPAIPLVYGKVRQKATPIYHRYFGSVKMHVYAVAEGEINGIKNVYFDKQPVIVADKTYSNGVIPQEDLNSPWKSSMQVEVRSGTADQAVLQTITNKKPDEWGADKKGNNVALIAFTMLEQGNAADVNKLPDVEIEFYGRKVADIRHEGNPIVYSNNPALCLYDLLTNKRFGVGVNPGLISTASFINAANECDTLKLTCNGYIDMTKPVKKGIDELLKSFGGNLYEYNGTLIVDTNKPRVSVTHFDESNIVGKLTIKHAPTFGTVNTIVGKFKDAGAGYENRTVVLPKDRTDAILKEGEDKQEKH